MGFLCILRIDYSGLCYFLTSLSSGIPSPPPGYMKSQHCLKGINVKSEEIIYLKLERLNKQWIHRPRNRIITGKFKTHGDYLYLLSAYNNCVFGPPAGTGEKIVGGIAKIMVLVMLHHISHGWMFHEPDPKKGKLYDWINRFANYVSKFSNLPGIKYPSNKVRMLNSEKETLADPMTLTSY